MSDYIYIAVKNPCAKELNKQPWLEVRRYKVDHYTKKSVVLKCGKSFPLERCFATEEEAFDSANGFTKDRTWGDNYEPKWTGMRWE